MKKERDRFCPAEVQGIVSDLHGVYIICLTSAARVLINLRHVVTHDDHASTPAKPRTRISWLVAMLAFIT